MRQQPREGGIGTQPRKTQTPTALERALLARKDYRREQAITRSAVAGAQPGAVARFIGGIGQHPLTSLRDVSGIDVHHFYHPIRTVQKERAHAAELGRQYAAGKISGSEAASGNIGMFPGGGPMKGLGRLLGRAVGRGAADVAEAVPKPKPEIFTAGEKVRKSLPEARRLRAEQKKMYSAERTARVERAQVASEKAGGGIAGHYAGLAEQKGALPKTTFARLAEGNLGQADVEQLVRQIDRHPKLGFYEKQTARSALLDAFQEGRTPAPHEIKLLHEVFGQEAVSHMRTLRSRIGPTAMDALNIPRSLMATFDVSGAFRQALVASAGHPRIFARNFGPMFKHLVSEKYHQASLAAIHERPNYPLYEQSGVRFTEQRGQTSKLREERFSSDLAEKIPALGHIVRASGRAYTGLLNTLRADIFDSMLETAHKKGINIENKRFLRSVGAYASSATGRGGMKPFGMNLETSAPLLNTVFFSPRLIASRLNFLDPTWYFQLDPFVRKQALKSILTLGAGSGAALAIAGQYVGAKVGTDPRSADFAKMRFGNTRLDILGGFQQYVRLASQLEQGKIVSSSTGRTMTLGPGFGSLSRKDILQRFIEGKFSPPAAFVNDFFKGTTFSGQPFEIKQALLQRIIPLVAQDAYDLQKSQGSVPLTAAGYATAALGVGLQTYGDPVKAKAATKLHEATKQQNVHLANLVKKGALPRGQVKEYREALDIYDKRNQINTTIDAATKDKPIARETQKIQALLTLLAEHKLLKPADVKRYQHHCATAKLTPKELQRDRDWFWRSSGIATMITWYRGVAGAND